MTSPISYKIFHFGLAIVVAVGIVGVVGIVCIVCHHQAESLSPEQRPDIAAPVGFI